MLETRTGLGATTRRTSPSPYYSLHEGLARAASPFDGRAELVYNWVAFLLNFWSHMPPEAGYTAETIQTRYFPRMRDLYLVHEVSAYEAPHATLALYTDGGSWFEDDHKELIRSFFEGLPAIS